MLFCIYSAGRREKTRRVQVKGIGEAGLKRGGGGTKETLPTGPFLLLSPRCALREKIRKIKKNTWGSPFLSFPQRTIKASRRREVESHAFLSISPDRHFPKRETPLSKRRGFGHTFSLSLSLNYNQASLRVWGAWGRPSTKSACADRGTPHHWPAERARTGHSREEVPRLRAVGGRSVLIYSHAFLRAEREESSSQVSKEEAEDVTKSKLS